MRKILNVRGTQSEVSSLEVNVDTVYSRTNIQRIETEDFNGWQYDEMQFTLREYQESLGGMTTSLGKSRETIMEDTNLLGEMISSNIENESTMAETIGILIEQIKLLEDRIIKLEGGNVND